VVETAGPPDTAQSDDSASPGWTGRTRRAFAFGTADMDTPVVALAGFLLRGGIVLLMLPSVVLPSVLGLAAATGVQAFGIDGRPTPWLFEVAVMVSLAVGLWLALAVTIGSLIDVWLIEAALGRDERAAGRPRPLPDLRIVLDLAGIRAVCLVPLVGTIFWAGSRVYDTVYRELTTPTDLATPLPLRVVEDAADAILVVALIWLASEVIAAIAVRRLVLLDAGIWRSIAGAFVHVTRRPVSSASTVIVTFGASIVATGLAMASTAVTFDWCRVAARSPQPLPLTVGLGSLTATRDFRPVVFILATMALAAAWVATLAVSGIASAWRSAALTTETAAGVTGPPTNSAEAGLGLSGRSSERSGD
jgi:hypothetical protein